MNFRRRRRETADVNLTPLIDVVFLLLIFFMVSTTFDKQSRIKVQLPEASQQKQLNRKDATRLDITVSATGKFYVNDREVINTDIDTLKRAIDKVAKGKTDIPVVISADANTPYQAVITVMDAASQMGLNNMSFPISVKGDGSGGE